MNQCPKGGVRLKRTLRGRFIFIFIFIPLILFLVFNVGAPGPGEPAARQAWAGKRFPGNQTICKEIRPAARPPALGRPSIFIILFFNFLNFLIVGAPRVARRAPHIFYC